MSKGSLYVCATPIGHLDDCSYRLISTLEKVGCIAAEDTRYTLRLLKRYQLSKPLLSLEKFNEVSRVDRILSYLKSGQSVALVSDAGTPTISDPGSVLVRSVKKAGYEVFPVPGPSAILTLLSVSGLDEDQFLFSGFLPRKPSELRSWYERFRDFQVPIVFYESPKRLMKSLALFNEWDSDAWIVLGKEMTKQFEQFFEGKLNDVVSKLSSGLPLKGEWCGVIVFTSVSLDEMPQMLEDIENCRSQGMSDSQILFMLTYFRGYKKNVIKKVLFNTKS